MAGTINWNATFVPTIGDVYAEIYDGDGTVVLSKLIPCKPPVNCQFVMDNVETGEYKAALALEGDRYYYVEGQSIITKPNGLDHASTVEIGGQDQVVELSIYVNIL